MNLATSLAAAIKDEFGVEARLVEGHEGIFQVSLSDQVIYSNDSQCGTLPTPEEIAGLIRGDEIGPAPQIPMMPSNCGCGPKKPDGCC